MTSTTAIEITTWLTENGFSPSLSLEPLQRGLGANSIWRLKTGPTDPALVVRLFRAGNAASATRERLAMQAARIGGVPAPEVIVEGVIGERPVMITSLMPGALANDALFANPASARDLGVALGTTLGHIHQIAAPPGLVADDRSWISQGGPTLAPLRKQLEAISIQDRLLHLDFHPRNVLVGDGAVTGVIDWENTAVGPPHADLARSRAILRMLTFAEVVPPEVLPVVAAFEDGLVEGHRQVVGPDPNPALMRAWGLAMTAADLAGQVGKPGSVVTSEALRLLNAERDEAFLVALNS